MHLGRFHYALWELERYYVSQALSKKLTTVRQALETYAAGPTPEQAVAFRTALDAFITAASVTPEEFAHPLFKAITATLKGEKYIGEGLVKHITTLVSDSGLIAAELLDALDSFKKPFDAFVASVSKAANGLWEVNTEYEALEGGQFELGVLLPREAVGSTVTELNTELQHIDRLFKAINELLGRGADSPVLRTINTSWYDVFLLLDTIQISAAVFGIERIVTLYKQSLEIRRLRREAEQQDIGEEILAAMDKRIEDRMKNGIEQIAIDMRQKFQKNTDAGRMNEIEIQLKLELTHIAKRINQGAKIDIRAGLPKPPKQPKPEGADAQQLQQYDQHRATYEAQLITADELNRLGIAIASQMQSLGEGQPLLLDYEQFDQPPKPKTLSET